jgi:hypothetical protein
MTDNRPSNVIRFEQLMYLSIALGVINTAHDWNRLVSIARPEGGAAFVLFVNGGVLGILILLIWLSARRAKNWARWVYLAIFVLGLPGGGRQVAINLSQRPVSGIIGVIQTALQVAALFLIFTGNSREWFRRETGQQGM